MLEHLSSLIMSGHCISIPLSIHVVANTQMLLVHYTLRCVLSKPLGIKSIPENHSPHCKKKNAFKKGYLNENQLD